MIYLTLYILIGGILYAELTESTCTVLSTLYSVIHIVVHGYGIKYTNTQAYIWGRDVGYKWPKITLGSCGTGLKTLDLKSICSQSKLCRRLPCLRPLQVDNIFVIIRQAPVPACWLFKPSTTS